MQTGSGDPAAVAVQAGAHLWNKEFPGKDKPTCRDPDALEVVAEVEWARRGYKSLCCAFAVKNVDWCRTRLPEVRDEGGGQLQAEHRDHDDSLFGLRDR